MAPVFSKFNRVSKFLWSQILFSGEGKNLWGLLIKQPFTSSGVDFTLLFGYREAFGHQAKVKYKV